MDPVATPTSISRFDSRFRRRAQNIPPHKESVPESQEKEEEATQESLVPEPRGRDSMSRGHRFFHRRAGLGNTKVVTVAVEVVATVDTDGNLVSQETMAPVTPQASDAPTLPTAAVVAAAAAVASPAPAPSVAPAAQQPLPSALLPVVPSVPSVPTVALPVLPSVPAVPPFPSDLVVPTVPGYPFATGSPVAQVAASSNLVSASPISTGGPESTATPGAPPLSAISFILNSTTSSTAPLLSSSFASLDSISASPSTELIASIAAVPTRSASASQSVSQPLSSSSRAPSSQTSIDPASTRSTAIVSDAASTTYYGDFGGAASDTAAAPAATTQANSDANTSPSPLETPQVVGSIVGSLAGAALILAIILLLLRRHKRKQGGALQLTGDDHTDNNQSMRQAPTTSSAFVPIAFLNRFSGISGKTAESNLSGGERSFQRVSGRKLPSAFSEGMTSDQFSRGGTMSGSSFYQDDHGTYGGPALSKEFGKEIGDSPMSRESGPMNIRPSPARTPVIRHPDDGNPFADRNYLSPPQSPNPDVPPRGTLGRSLPSADGSRSSRFTENV